ERWREYDTVQLQELLDAAEQQAGQLSDLTDDLLLVARATSETLTFAPREVDLITVAVGLLSGLQVNPEVSVTVPEGEAIVWADPGRVRQILRNLVANTVRYAHRAIRLDVEATPARVRLVVRNDGGTLEAKALLEQPLTQEASNAVRKLFQINRVETAAAAMSEIVLVPEGRYDCAWLELLLRVAELDQQAQAPCLFGTRIGVAPTSDAMVRETCDTLAKSHPRICALVDGDADGHRYADNLDEEDAGAGRVLLWPDGWTMEDVIGWILAADEAAVLGALNRDFDNGFVGRQDLVDRLKSENRDQHGLKGDLVAYETIANAITGSAACSARTKDLLNAISAACSGENTALFPIVPERDNMIPRMVFAP
ncbi:MAG: hypothetical protein WD079_02585, partial [Phycisphaeraceae bacterium]